MKPASSGRGHLSKYSPNPRHHHHHLLFLHSPVRVKEWEAGRLAKESRAKSLNVPQQQHQELRRGQPSVRASVPVHRAKVALLGGVDVSFLIFAASVHYPGRLKTRALIPSNPSQNTHTHTHTPCIQLMQIQIHTAVRHFYEDLAHEYAYFSLMLCSTRAHALQEGCVASLEFNCGCWKPYMWLPCNKLAWWHTRRHTWKANLKGKKIWTGYQKYAGSLQNIFILKGKEQIS